MTRRWSLLLGIAIGLLIACQPTPMPQIVQSLDLPSMYRRLAQAGFDPGPYNLQDFTQLTQAVQRFQRFAQLPDHGVIDARTLEQLQQLYDPGPSQQANASATITHVPQGERSTVVAAYPIAKVAEDWTADDNMRLYFEAITYLQKNALQPLTSRDIVQHTLQSYLRSLDAFSEYLSPEEYAQYKNTQQPHYMGVGMDIQRVASGRVMCTPYPGGPAAQAGITAGDILEAVDGRRLADQSLLTLSAQVRGRQGSQVRLTITTRDGALREFTITRAAVRAQSVLIERGGPLPIIRLLTFTRETLKELQDALRQFDNKAALIIDLRHNPGGSLYSAIDAAKLFLAPNQQVVGLQTRSGIKTYRKETSTQPLRGKLYLWQDEYTASAAEVFIAALTHNQRAVSIGKKTFGKGTVQEIVELKDGSALYLTTGTLLTPDGAPYHEKGLTPTYPLEIETAKTDDYIAQVTALLR